MSVKQLFDLTGRKAIITGGSRGLGLQIAEALGEQGAEVLLSARKADELEQAVQHLSAMGIRATAIAADMGKPDDVARFADEALARLGEVDILVNNAGATWGAPAEDHPLEEWLKLLNVNLTGVFLLTQAVGKREAIAPVAEEILKKFGKVDILVNNAGATWGAPAEDHPLEAWDKLVNVNLTGAFVLTQLLAKRSMIPAKWGRVINIASIAGLMGQDKRIVQTIAYNATKGGLVNFTRALAAEWGEYGITVNAICPGFFPSKMTRATLGTTGELIRDWTPTKRLGNDEDLKGLVVLLASEASRHITGQAIAVDGGATVI